jgi:glutamyl-tRNA synthetase
VKAKLGQIVQAAGDRIKVAGDVLEYGDFFLPDDQLPFDEKAFDKRIRKPVEAAGLLERFRDRLREAQPSDAGSGEKLVQHFVLADGVNLGQIIHALRVAVTGKAVGFGLFESLAVLGKEHSLARMDRALTLVRPAS